MLAPRGGADVEEPKEFEVAPVLEAAVRRWQEGRPGPLPQLTVAPDISRARTRLPVRAFEQAIANLLDNAAEATAGRSAREVRVSLTRAQDGLRLSVADNGVGVPEPLLRRIGEPFFTTKEPGLGTGLGLYLARHVVEREGVSFSHLARFVLIGSMNPEEGDLRPQLLDRFALAVDILGIRDPAARMAILERNLAFGSQTGNSNFGQPRFPSRAGNRPRLVADGAT